MFKGGQWDDKYKNELGGYPPPPSHKRLHYSGGTVKLLGNDDSGGIF